MEKKTAYLILMLGMVLALNRPAGAATFVQTNSFRINESEIIAGDLWLSANAIDIRGAAKDDLFLLATAATWKTRAARDGAILLAGQFANDVWALGNKIDLTGQVQDHARLLARIITVSGSVSNSSMLAANSIHLTPAAQLGRDVRLIGENIMVEGSIDGNLNIVGKDVTLAGLISGDVNLTAAEIAVRPPTRINGNLVYRAPQELVLDKNVVVQGRLIREAEEITPATRRPLIAWPSLLLQFWLYISALGVGALALGLLPAFLEDSAHQIRNSAWKSLLIGFIGVGLAPLVCIFLAISIIGLPLAILAAMFFWIMIYLSKFTVALALAALIFRRKVYGIRAFPVMSLGLALLYLAAGTGLLGALIWFLIVCLGLGGMISAYSAKRPGSAR